MVPLQLLILLMIISALIAIEAEGSFTPVIALGVLGLELSLAFLLLKAPDIAIVLLVAEMIALAVIAALIAKQKPGRARDLDPFSALTFIAFAVLFVIISLKALSETPRFGAPLMKLADLYLAQSMAKAGAPNVVAAIAFNFRGLDSLIALIILFLTAIGIFHLTGKKE